MVRHLGSRDDVTAAAGLYRVWLPASGEAAGEFPVYVDIGPRVREEEMLTDVYLPLR